MAEKGDDPQTKALTWDEVSYSNMIQHEALISLLLEKGVITEEEYLDKVRQVTRELQDRQAGQ
ncbi:conserved hypothetical protein [Desulfonatronospira thiodismutans ASO3-1]|uniref:SHOCT domain-containing protein n=1 Tax=Desulfonatronospira thiodismutans ASO3-1 TaxID=555779 RepID=D6SLB7_9BACT|nr:MULTISPECIES: hypothetical protein [Desulfonatronospira]EFI35478.1 conserved hypothetical protein [Desulfonatronospira thiodismutans ASO3-1]RQD76671.1 MAG: hypothetical protein D5S03_05710 [Desulfonatronospira sp. MSAO_Bac3]RQD76683.1 MAG: hypothetical protein D5S03_05690 [Desulfonatronospira sp. MSAO_Bac3]